MIDWSSWLLQGMVAAQRAAGRWLTFEVHTAEPLPAGEQVFLAGNQQGMGWWKPDGFPLTRMADNLWVGQALCTGDGPVEFKVTRGAWETEELLEDGSLPANRQVPVDDKAVVRVAVARWKDIPLELPPCIAGAFRKHEGIHSEFLRFDRRVIVWLPPSYDLEPERRYPVIYLQDGQQIFDPRTSSQGQDWQVDEEGLKLITAGQIGEFIAVAVYSTQDREIEYDPTQAGVSYVRFLIQELKPLMDSTYRTKPEAVNTALGGASLGGTLAFWGAWRHPETFGAAVCLSPALRFQGDRALLNLVEKTVHPPPIRLFLYGGLGDPTERELMEGISEMAVLLHARGYSSSGVLTLIEAGDGEHNERSWVRQTPAWLRFLYGGVHRPG